MGIHGGGGGGGSGGACDESVRSFIEHEEDNLDRDVVMEFLQMPLPLPLPMPHQDRPPRNPSVDRAVPQLSQHLPPQHQDPHQKQQRSQKSHLVNAVLRNSFSDFESAASVSTGAGAHSSVSGSKASKTHSFASMSDSELEHPDRRQRNSYGNVNGSGVSENHSPSSGASSSAVSFIRQKVISSSGYSPVAGAAIGRSRSTSVGASDANQSSNFPQPARSSHVPSAHSLYSGNGQGGGIASESGAAANKANTSPASVGDMPLNRLQALYERVTNKTT